MILNDCNIMDRLPHGWGSSRCLVKNYLQIIFPSQTENPFYKGGMYKIESNSLAV
jgi:hypothetical protein